MVSYAVPRGAFWIEGSHDGTTWSVLRCTSEETAHAWCRAMRSMPLFDLHTVDPEHVDGASYRVVYDAEEET